MLTIAIIEDNPALCEALTDVLAAEGHDVEGFNSAEAFWARGDASPYDVLVLDLNLPGEDGISFARRVRAINPDVGIVMLTARGEPNERRIGYENGADIYLTKPSSAPELTASVSALARRLRRNRREEPALVLDGAAMTLSGGAEPVALSAAEVDLLTALLDAPNHRVSISRIAALMGGEVGISKAAIEVRIVRLRKKMMMAGASGQPIKVIRNYGYQLSNQKIAKVTSSPSRGRMPG